MRRQIMERRPGDWVAGLEPWERRLLMLRDGFERSPAELLERRHVRDDAGWRWKESA